MNLGDVEKLNLDYLKLKNQKTVLEIRIADYEKELETLALDKDIYQGQIAIAIKNNNVLAKEKATEKFNKTKLKAKEIKDRALDDKLELAEVKERIDNAVEKIKSDPGLGKHINEVMQKRYERKISSLDEEKAKLKSEKLKIQNLQDVVEKHPTIKNNLTGILNAYSEKARLEKELAELSKTSPQIKQGDPKATQQAIADKVKKMADLRFKISDAETKYQTNKTLLTDYLGKNKINFTEKDIENLCSNVVMKDVKGQPYKEADLNATLNASVRKINRKIKGIDKNIDNNYIALNKTKQKFRDHEEFSEQDRRENRNKQNVQQENDAPVQENNSYQPEYSDENENRYNNSTENNEYYDNNSNNSDYREPPFKENDGVIYDDDSYDEKGNLNEEAKKPSLWERIKGFFQKILRKRLPEGEERENKEDEQENNEQGTRGENKKEEFRDSLKYDIVREITDDVEKKRILNAKQQRKENEMKNRNDDNER